MFMVANAHYLLAPCFIVAKCYGIMNTVQVVTAPSPQWSWKEPVFKITHFSV